MSNPQTTTKTIENGGGGVSVMENVDPQTGEITTIDPSFDTGQATLLTESEINQQITTARKYPRSVSDFRKKVLAMCTLNEAVAKECIYAVPRSGKVIEGPSIRFAEIAQSAWGNCRVGGRIVGEDAKFVTAQGAFHDLESNSAIAMEFRRRITDKNGRRYNDDMIGVTGAAAVSIAIRNAVLRGIPKALWEDLYQSSRKVVLGDFKTLSNKRAAALQAFIPYGIEPSQIFALMGIKAEEDMTPDHLIQLFGILNALKDGSQTPEEIFPKKDVPGKRPEKPAETKPKAEGETTGEPKPKPTRKAATKKDAPVQKDGEPAADPQKAAVDEKPAGDAEAREGTVAPGGAAETSPAGDAADDAPVDDGPGTNLRHFIDGLAKARNPEEIVGMRTVAKGELSPREFAVWQGAALATEAKLKATK